MIRKLLLVVGLLLVGRSVAQASSYGNQPCPVFVVDPDPNDPIYGHCSLRGDPSERPLGW